MALVTGAGSLIRDVRCNRTMNIEYVHLTRPYHFQSPFKGEDFVLFLYVQDEAVSVDEQATVSREIVQEGCRYAVCAGYACSTWDDSIDLAYLELNDYDLKDENFVMTSWHDKEPLADAVFHFLYVTSFEDFVADKFCVAVLGDGQAVVQEIRRHVKESTEPPCERDA